MTPLDATTVKEAFSLIRSHTPDEIHELVDTLEARLLLDESMLKMQACVERLMFDMLSAPGGGETPADATPSDLSGARTPDETGAELYPFPGHSVRVPSAWEQDARSVSLPDVGGLTLGDPRIDALREEGAL